MCKLSVISIKRGVMKNHQIGSVIQAYKTLVSEHAKINYLFDDEEYEKVMAGHDAILEDIARLRNSGQSVRFFFFF